MIGGGGVGGGGWVGSVRSTKVISKTFHIFFLPRLHAPVLPLCVLSPAPCDIEPDKQDLQPRPPPLGTWAAEGEEEEEGASRGEGREGGDILVIFSSIKNNKTINPPKATHTQEKKD